jgi:hypothetical protein
MCVCMCVCMYACMHACMYVCMCLFNTLCPCLILLSLSPLILYCTYMITSITFLLGGMNALKIQKIIGVKHGEVLSVHTVRCGLRWAVTYIGRLGYVYAEQLRAHGSRRPTTETISKKFHDWWNIDRE